MLVVLAACSTPEPTPTLPPPPTTAATAVPPATAEPTSAPEVVDPTDESWEAIQTAGVIRVGTSADYPPFSFYNDNFEIDGFEPALMQAIGDELGIEVQIVDYAFDGLYNELALGQIDAIISAVSITPNRQEAVNFSNAYYIGEDAILATADSPLENITALNQLATSRIGVQNGSVYQTWVNSVLVNSGLMSSERVSSYTDIRHAVEDLEAGQVDVVIMDATPAELLIQERGDIKRVGGGLYQQIFAIVLPQGADALTGQINEALATLNRNGVLSELAETYLDLSEVELPEETPEPPTPEPTPEVVATPTAVACVDSMSYVADLTYDDQNMTNPPILSPGQPFTKGWRVRNTGTCNWDIGYRLVYVQGNSPYARMGGEPVNVSRVVAPGETYDLQVNLVSPLVPGTF
ncbi:MAG: transporter substrate-binding domain-containing protein, partial [Anaerolineales bacterium]|nr:transporter substrate-binding domain-containing protein [Anaerolineales bacterium]